MLRNLMELKNCFFLKLVFGKRKAYWMKETKSLQNKFFKTVFSKKYQSETPLKLRKIMFTKKVRSTKKTITESKIHEKLLGRDTNIK